MGAYLTAVMLGFSEEEVDSIERGVATFGLLRKLVAGMRTTEDDLNEFHVDPSSSTAKNIDITSAVFLGLFSKSPYKAGALYPELKKIYGGLFDPKFWDKKRKEFEKRNRKRYVMLTEDLKSLYSNIATDVNKPPAIKFKFVHSPFWDYSIVPIPWGDRPACIITIFGPNIK